jgi:hypothetical protein
MSMKAFLFAAALTVGTAAFAQSGNTVSDPSQSSGPRGVTQQGTDPEGQPCTPPGYNAGVSAYPPCGATGTTEGPATGTDTASPPRCSKTVTDRCIQAYERGVRG